MWTLLLSAKHLSSIEFASYIINQLLILEKSLNSSGTDFPILAKAFDFLKWSVFWFYYLANYSFTKNVVYASETKHAYFINYSIACLVTIEGGVGYEKTKNNMCSILSNSFKISN